MTYILEKKPRAYHINHQDTVNTNILASATPLFHLTSQCSPASITSTGKVAKSPTGQPMGPLKTVEAEFSTVCLPFLMPN